MTGRNQTLGAKNSRQILLFSRGFFIWSFFWSFFWPIFSLLTVALNTSSWANAQTEERRSEIRFGKEKASEINTRGTSDALDDNLSNGHSLYWRKSYIGFKPKSSWQGYDELTFKAQNDTGKTVTANIEIKDRESTGYWTRVNYPIVMAPGESQITMPLPIEVGERSRRGRLLKLDQIVSVILARTSEAEGLVILTDFSLHKFESIKSDGLYAFSFSSTQPERFPGFTALTRDTTYNATAGYGFIKLKSWLPYPQAAQVLQPDRLYRNSILIQEGTLQVDLPNGEYEAVMNIDFAGGYWGEYALYKNRKVWVQDRLVVSESMTRDAAARGYFFHSLDEDHDEDSVFEKYVLTRFKEKTFRFKVTDGHAVFKFQGDNCALQACFGIALSSLVIFDVNNKANAQVFLAKVLKQRKADFESYFKKQSTDLHLPTAAASGLQVFRTEPGREDFVESNTTLELAQGQSGYISVWAISNKSERVSAKVEGLPPGYKVETSVVKRRITRTTPDGSQYRVADRYLEQSNHAQTPARFWIRVTAPDQVAARGPITTASITLTGVEKGKTTSQMAPQIKVPIQTAAFKLPPVDFPIGPFGHTIREGYWYDEEMDFRKQQLSKESLAKMTSRGLTWFSFSPELRANIKNKHLALTGFENIDRLIKHALATTGPWPLVAYGDILPGFDICTGNTGAFADMERDLFLTEFATQFAAAAEKMKWPKLYVLACDEPIEDQQWQAMERLRVLNKASSGNIIYAAATSFNPKANSAKKDPAFKLIDGFALVFLNLFPPELKELLSPKQRWIYYNSANRNTFGFGLARLKMTTPLAGRIAWHWSMNAADPYYALDSREDDIGWCNSLFNGSLQCSVVFDRHIDQGLTDYRYTLALAEWMKAISDAPAEQQNKASALWQKILKYPLNDQDWFVQDLQPAYAASDSLRSELFAFLKAMSEAKVKAKSK